ncbi:hypothetical protein [Qipengyuania qiaonensis]|uniref:Secreted protein n=1 Tax=Qipengyuania qiaonensis TaxID=2867240 RepID=A0ABS7J6Z1_9SPHN|nr:hypothetical protein [Qipengyuania qiaonensis]MBX7481864.1 hypothetical protein [Qipengyuania qiaonensis]
MSGQETTLAIAVAAAVVVLLFVWLFMRRHRTQALRAAFGEEYDRTVAVRGKRSTAEADLMERRERVSKFTTRPLTAAERDRYVSDWAETKALFVDSPVEAVSRADRLLTEVMRTRGYPMADFEHRHADLTVDHGDVAKHYLAGQEIAARSNDATTEELRRALNHYEALFADMTGEVAEVDEPVAARKGDGDGDSDLAQSHAPVRPAAFGKTARPASD